MEVIRQFIKVKNHKINITLPDNFTADEVEVIIFAKSENDFQITEDQIKLLDDRVNDPESEYIASAESLKKNMGFKIIVSKKAQSEIENAIEYYAEINSNLALKFYSALNETYSKIEINPFY